MAIITLIFSFQIVLSSALPEIKQVEEINGYVTDLEFDYNSNIYGVENISKFKLNKTIIFEYCVTVYEWSRFLFKLDSDKKVAWKIVFRDGIVGSIREFDYILDKTKILINRQNDVYLLVEKEKVTEIYSPIVNDSAVVLKKVSEYSSQILVSEPFIIDDNIIVAGFSDDDIPSRSFIRILKTKTGMLVILLFGLQKYTNHSN